MSFLQGRPNNDVNKVFYIMLDIVANTKTTLEGMKHCVPMYEKEKCLHMEIKNDSKIIAEQEQFL